MGRHDGTVIEPEITQSSPNYKDVFIETFKENFEDFMSKLSYSNDANSDG